MGQKWPGGHTSPVTFPLSIASVRISDITRLACMPAGLGESSRPMLQSTALLIMPTYPATKPTSGAAVGLPKRQKCPAAQYPEA